MNTDDKNPDGAPGEGERIAKVLSRAGVASRRDAERLVLEGRVRLNGEVVTSPATNVTPRDRLAVDGEEVGAPEATRLWIFHKPAGLVTTEHDEEGRPTVFDSLPEDMPRVMSVGRLDLTSEGLLLLTNDGEVKRRLELPSTGWLRRYRVRINGSLSEEQLDELRRGITVEGIDYQPMEVSFDRQQGANAWLTIGLREGKNREIRRAIEHMGATVNRLIRVSYGPFQLGDLPVGEVEEVRARVVRDQLGLAKPEPARTRRRPPAEEVPAPDGGAPDRPGRDPLATPRPAGATVKRELKARVPKARGQRTGEEAPRARAPRPARKAAGPEAFAKPRTWMRAGEARAAREEAPEGERPQRPRAVPGAAKPRSAGYKSHARPEGGEGRPRAAGFRSHKAEGERPPRRREDEGERPRPRQADPAGGARPAGPRPPRDGDGRPARAFKPRAPRAGEERPARADKPGAGGDRPYKPRAPREGEERPRQARPARTGEERPYRPRAARAAEERPARAFKPRGAGDGNDGPSRPDRPRAAREGGDRPERAYKPRPPREGEQGRPARPPRSTEGGDRPARPDKPRGGGDRPSRPYKPREADQPARPDRPDRPPREAGARPPRPDRPDGGRPFRPGGAGGPGGPGGPRKGPPRAGGAKPGRPAGPKPRKG